MKRFILFLVFLLCITSTAHAAPFTLSWTAPTTNEDGTPLTDLGGYRLYYGIAPGIYSVTLDVGNVTTSIVELPPDVRYYFAVTAYDTGGNESAFSNEVSKIKYLDPAAPLNLQVQ